jgi:3D (Asp-Asp-Asp) domain-containing protein
MINITNAVITAYCACKICCGPHAHGICADGRRPVEGVTVAASRRIPLGTHISIDGHEYIVQDRLESRYDNRFDVFMNHHNDAKKHGLQHKDAVLSMNGTFPN